MHVIAAAEAALAIGGMTFRVRCDDPRLVSPADGVRAFLVDPAGSADVDIVARIVAEPADSTGRVVFDSGGAWRLHESNGTFAFTFRSSLRGSQPYKSARFDHAFARGEILVHAGAVDAAEPIYALEYPLDELVMIHWLAQGRGVEVHGCALLDDRGRAFVFAGQSGAGKSTIARLWASTDRVTLLSDERVVLRTDGDRIRVYGTPWHGDAQMASPASGDLAGVFFLHHGTANRIVGSPPPLSAAALFSCAFLPFHSAPAVDHTMAAIARVTRDVPCHDLWFTPNRSAIDAAAAAMR